MLNSLKVLGSVSPYCKNENNCSGYLLQSDSNKILLDCGPGVVSKMNMPNDLENLTIVISHFHKDHYVDLFSLGYASFCYHRMGRLNNKIKLYLPEVKPGEEGYEDYLMIRNLKEQYFDICVYNEHSKVSVGTSNVSFCRTQHSITNFSIKVENSDAVVVYTGDMGFANIDRYVAFCRDASLLICESTYLESDNVQDSNHLHAKEAAYIAFLANVNTLMLTHFWPEHDKKDYVEEARLIFDNTVAADESMSFDLVSKNKILR